jgi:hypothetical protein
MRSASITCMIRHYVTRRAQVTAGQPRSTAMRLIGSQGYEGSAQAAGGRAGVPPCTAAEDRVRVRVDCLRPLAAPRVRNLRTRAIDLAAVTCQDPRRPPRAQGDPFGAVDER